MTDSPDPNAPSPPGTSSTQTDAGEDPNAIRFCVACGYNLFGLGDEPRCPECGLLNIPTGLRQLVWDRIDSGCWFFSSFLGIFEKRTPGWWWALDRPGDVARSFRHAARSVLLAAFIILLFAAASDSVGIESRTQYRMIVYHDADNPERSTVIETEWIRVQGMLGRVKRWDTTDKEIPVPIPLSPATIRSFSNTSYRVVVEPSMGFLSVAGPVLIWAFWLWACPAWVGLWTQIRKGLPAYAKAPRTIIAASNYEAHRMVYLACAIAAWLVIDVALRVTVFRTSPVTWGMSTFSVGLVVYVYGVLGWVGPLRSDHTRQLVRSRWHAVRILVMYALICPFILTGVTMEIILFSLGFLGIEP